MLTYISENLQPFDANAKDAFSLNKTALINFISCIEKSGAQYIDVNLGPIKREKEKIVAFFVNTIETASHLKIFIDSTDYEVIEIAINVASRKPIINGFSMEEKKIKSILPLAKKYGCQIVGLVMSDAYIPNNLDDKILLSEQMIKEVEKTGLSREQLILDPIVAPLGWADGVNHNIANIEFVRVAKQLFGENIKTMCGLSNLTTRSAKGSNKGLLQSYYLSMLYGAGIDMVMLNVFDTALMHTVKFIKTLDEKRIFSFDEFAS